MEGVGQQSNNGVGITARRGMEAIVGLAEVNSGGDFNLKEPPFAP